jgi:hypothetical protein
MPCLIQNYWSRKVFYGDLPSNLASFLNLLLVVLDYRINGRAEFIRAFKDGNRDDKEILQQFTALLLHEFTCSFSRATCKRGTCTCKSNGNSRNQLLHPVSRPKMRTRGYDVVDNNNRLSRLDGSRLHFKLVLLTGWVRVITPADTSKVKFAAKVNPTYRAVLFLV